MTEMEFSLGGHGMAKIISRKQDTLLPIHHLLLLNFYFRRLFRQRSKTVTDAVLQIFVQGYQ